MPDGGFDRRTVLVGGTAAVVGFAGATVLRGDGPDAGSGVADTDGRPSGASDALRLSSDDADAAANAEIINRTLREGDGRVVLPAGRYPVGRTIVLPNVPGAGLAGAGAWSTTLVRAPGAELDAVVATERWLDDSGYSQQPVQVVDLTIDGNRSEGRDSGVRGDGSGTHGLVLVTFGSTVRRVRVVETAGDGFRLANGSREGLRIENDAVENRFVDCEARAVGGYGLHAPNTPGEGRPGTTDTFVDRFICQDPGLGYVRADRAGGWKIVGAHCYTTEPGPGFGHGLDLRSCFGTTVVGCNIDTWGGAADGPWAGLHAEGVSGRPSVIQGNVFETKVEPAGAPTAIALAAASGQQPYWTVTGNTATSRAPSPTLRLVTLAARGDGGRNRGIVTGNGLHAGATDGGFDGGGPAAADAVQLEANSINRGTAPPSAGYWPAGTIVRASDPTAVGTAGWLCTTAGRPGRWTPIETPL